MASGFGNDPSEGEATRSRPVAETIGTSGLRQSSGYIREEFLTDLQGMRGREAFHEMSLNDSTAAAVLFAIKMLLRSVQWTVEPSDPDDNRSVEMAELVDGMLMKDMQHTWPEAVDAACSMFVYGFAVQEVTWKKRNGWNRAKPWLSSDYDDGLWAPRALSSRSQRSIDRWIFDEEGNILGFEQQPWVGSKVVVPMSRCLHFRTTTEMDNPEGHSVLRSAYRPWYFLKRLQEIEGVGTERDLAGYPVLKLPSEILQGKTADTAAARNSYLDFLRNVRRDNQEGVMIPSDRDESGNPFYEFTLINAGGSRNLGINDSIGRYQRDITRSVMADFIFLGADGGGSLALGRSKVQTFALAMRAYLNHIASQYNEDLIPMIWRINGLDDALRPKLTPSDIEPADLEAIGSFLHKMTAAGFDLGGDTDLEGHLRAKAEFPPKQEEEDEDADLGNGVFDLFPAGMVDPETGQATPPPGARQEATGAPPPADGTPMDGEPPEDAPQGLRVVKGASTADWMEALFDGFDG